MTKKDEQGRWIDGAGNPIPPKYIGAVEKRRERLVEKLIKRSKKLNRQLAAFRALALEDIEKYLTELEERYKINARTREGNKMLSNFSNTQRLEIRVSKYIEFDERLALAKEKIETCINKWSKGANGKLMLLVRDAFKVDKKGNIDKARVLGLKKLNIKDKDWKQAMEIISDSIQVVDSRTYLRFSLKDDEGRWRTIPLDIAAL